MSDALVLAWVAALALWLSIEVSDREPIREVWDAFLALLNGAARGPCDGHVPSERVKSRRRPGE